MSIPINTTLLRQGPAHHRSKADSSAHHLRRTCKATENQMQKRRGREACSTLPRLMCGHKQHATKHSTCTVCRCKIGSLGACQTLPQKDRADFECGVICTSEQAWQDKWLHPVKPAPCISLQVQQEDCQMTTHSVRTGGLKCKRAF